MFKWVIIFAVAIVLALWSTGYTYDKFAELFNEDSLERARVAHEWHFFKKLAKYHFHRNVIIFQSYAAAASQAVSKLVSGGSAPAGDL
eukprot:8544147-Pyramimonas_sp.AAC.1